MAVTVSQFLPSRAQKAESVSGVQTQSESLDEVAPGGQQLSPSLGSVICSVWQTAKHPVSTSTAFAQLAWLAQLSAVGQAPSPEVIAVSHFSGESTRPSPHVASGQSSSFDALHLAGQHLRDPLGNFTVFV